MIRLTVKRPGIPPSELLLDVGRHAIGGGGAGDSVSLPGAPPSVGWLLVAPDGAVSIVAARGPGGLTVRGRDLVAGERCLLRPGDALRVAAWQVSIAGPAQDASARGHDTTARLALGLLAAEVAGAPAAAPVSASLVWLNGRDCGRRLLLGSDEALDLGRSEGVRARIRDRLASKRHARLVVAEGRPAELRDLDSTNGVFVDGRRVRGAVRLTGGEVIRIGQTEIGFEAAPQPAAPPRARAAADDDSTAARAESERGARRHAADSPAPGAAARRWERALVAAAGTGAVGALAAAAWLVLT